MPIVIQTKVSARFTNVHVSPQERLKNMQNNDGVADTIFEIGANEIKTAPDWIKDDWMFDGLVADGNLVEIKPLDAKAVDKSKFPKGSPDPGIAQAAATANANAPALPGAVDGQSNSIAKK